MRILAAGAESSLNVKGAYLEVWADMLGSLGVLIAGVVIYFTRWMWVDTLVAVAIGLWVLPRTWKLLKESLNILLEGVPLDIALDDIHRALLAVPGVQAIHDLHVWALSSGRNSLTVHVVLAPGAAEQEVLRAAARMLEERFRLTHTTIQVEAAACAQESAHAPHSEEHHHSH
jgi:cobalt-zinc-cadmium efflux system protein